MSSSQRLITWSVLSAVANHGRLGWKARRAGQRRGLVVQDGNLVPGVRTPQPYRRQRPSRPGSCRTPRSRPLHARRVTLERADVRTVASQSRIVRSLDADASVWLSGDHASPLTSPACPLRDSAAGSSTSRNSSRLPALPPHTEPAPVRRPGHGKERGRHGADRPHPSHRRHRPELDLSLQMARRSSSRTAEYAMKLPPGSGAAARPCHVVVSHERQRPARPDANKAHRTDPDEAADGARFAGVDGDFSAPSQRCRRSDPTPRPCRPRHTTPAIDP